MSKSCNHCGNEIKWPEPYYKGALPLNPDGSEHRCKGKTEEKFDRREAGETGSINKDVTTPQAKDFAKMVDQQLFDDGYARAIRKRSLLLGIRKALQNESEPVIGMIFNQICADLRL